MKKFFKILGTIVATLICIVLFVVQVFTHFVFVANRTLSEENINTLINSIDIKDLLNDENGNKNSLYGTIDNTLSEYNFTSEQKEAIITSSAFKNITSAIISGAIKTSMTGEISFTKDDFNKLVDDNFEEIITASNIKINDLAKEILKEQIKANADEMLISWPSINNLEIDPNTKTYISLILSDSGKYYLIGAIVILTMLIALFRWSFLKCLKSSGIVTLISSIVILIISLLLITAPVILTKIDSNISQYAILINNLAQNLMKPFLISGGIGLGAAIIELVIAFFWKKASLNKAYINNEI